MNEKLLEQSPYEEFSSVYLTKYNLSNLVSQYRPKGVPVDMRDIYKTDLTSILSTPELSLLYCLMLAYEEKEFDVEKYVKLKPRYATRMAFDSGSPAFHKTQDCIKLLSDFKGIQIPIELWDRGEEEIEKFRSYCRKNKKLYEDNLAFFLMNATSDFKLSKPLEEITRDNSGAASARNYSLDSLEETIDTLLYDAEQFRNMDEVTRDKIFKLGFGTDRVSEAKIVGSILYTWHNKYKLKLKYLLREYFRLKFNPDIEFNGNLLEQLGFVACKTCATNHPAQKSIETPPRLSAIIQQS